jgi:biopolymer transport protein ExbD
MAITPIVVPGRRVGAAYSTSAAAKKKLKRGKKSTYAELMLTSMVDMFTILVLYLIQSFSSSGQILFVDPSLTLPDAHRAIDMVGNPPVITISNAAISVQGKPVMVATVPGNKQNPGLHLSLADDGEWAAPKIEEKLKEMRDLSTRVANATGGQVTTESSQGVIIIQADVGVPYMLIKKVLFTANKTGFTQVNFAVNHVADSGQVAAAE